MSWEDRLLQAAYTSPGGTRQRFDYENVSRRVGKKTSEFQFADTDGTLVQDTGSTGRRYPLRCIFHGPDHDLAARSFEALLLERGAGVLEHPMYGKVDVVPVGEISRRDDLVSAANQSIIEVEFLETLDFIFPRNQDHPADEVASAVDAYNAAQAEQFEGLVNVDLAADRADLSGSYNRLLDGASSALDDLASAQQEVREQFDTIETSITRGIDTLIRDPLSLAFQTSQLIQAPARAAQSIRDRLDAYKDLAESIFTGRGADTSNRLASQDLFAQGAMTGSVVSSINHEFATRPEAIEAAERLLDEFRELQAWREGQYAALDETDTGESYQKLQSAVSLAAGFLVEISFDLAPERSIVTDRPRTMIDLVAELYGEVDERLDQLILNNRLTGDEHLEIPAGRRIVYYR